MTQSELLAQQLEGTREWTLNLIDDLTSDQWTFQPGPGLAHALWLCGHVASAQNTLIHVRCLGHGVLDGVFASHFPIGEPVKPAADYDYPSVELVRKVMVEIHTKTVDAVRNMSDALLAEPASGKDGQPHPHYSDKRGAVSHCSRHEAFHAGQLATIRRLLGKPFIR